MDNRVRIFDTTLRDGEQSPGASMNVEEKIMVARQLAKLGVDIIEAGFAFSSPGDFEAVRRIAAAGAGPAWVLLGEFGEDGAGVATGFRRIEMRVPDGLGMHSYIDIDATTFLPLYGIEILQLDPDTGEFAGSHARPERQEFTDREEWLAAIKAIKTSSVG